MITLHDPSLTVWEGEIIIVENDRVTCHRLVEDGTPDNWVCETYDMPLSEAKAMLPSMPEDSTIWCALGQGKMYCEDYAAQPNHLIEMALSHAARLLTPETC